MPGVTRLILPKWLAEEEGISQYLREHVREETDDAILFGKKILVLKSKRKEDTSILAMLTLPRKIAHS